MINYLKGNRSIVKRYHHHNEQDHKDSIHYLKNHPIFLQPFRKKFRYQINQQNKIENQGVNIEYDDSKNGDTTLLFIHGWNIDKSYWTDQNAYFSKKNRVVAIDFPGFGKSGKNRKNWSVEEYGKEVTSVLTQLDLKNVILIGHSMSGAIALETALKNPNRVIRLNLIFHPQNS